MGSAVTSLARGIHGRPRRFTSEDATSATRVKTRAHAQRGGQPWRPSPRGHCWLPELQKSLLFSTTRPFSTSEKLVLYKLVRAAQGQGQPRLRGWPWPALVILHRSGYRLGTGSPQERQTVALLCKDLPQREQTRRPASIFISGEGLSWAIAVEETVLSACCDVVDSPPNCWL